MTQMTLDVPGIHCSGCADSIRKSLSQLPGVLATEVDVQTRQVRVSHSTEDVSLQQILNRLEDIGFEATLANA